MTKEDDDGLNAAAEIALTSLSAHKDDPKLMKNIIKAYGQLNYWCGYANGYDIGHKHGETGKDDRVVAHLN